MTAIMSTLTTPPPTRKGLKNLKNVEVRRLAKEKNVRHWQIADEIGVSESTFVHWLRKELSDEKKEKIIAAIEKISDGGEE